MRVAPEGFQRRDGISTLADDRNEILLEEEEEEERVRRNFSKAVPPPNTLYSYLDPRGNERFFLVAFSQLPPIYIYIYISLHSLPHRLDLNFRYTYIYISYRGARNIHPRVATTGSQRCGITGRIKNQYFR